jgi:hypothetical protein
MNSEGFIQVSLPLDPDSWHGTSSEGIWARLVKALPPYKAIVEVDNIPFFTRSLSLRDKISIMYDEGRVKFDAVFERGGHSTCQVFVENESFKASRMLDMVKAIGCDREMAEFRGGKLYALDIPPEVDIHEVYEILDKGQREGSWLFQEGYVGHTPRGAPVSPARKSPFG